jgi:hypothetical protein
VTVHAQNRPKLSRHRSCRVWRDIAEQSCLYTLRCENLKSRQNGNVISNSLYRLMMFSDVMPGSVKTIRMVKSKRIR